jgi:hypothetical protein
MDCCLICILFTCWFCLSLSEYGGFYFGVNDSHSQLDASTALMCAAENGNADCVRLLIDAGADKDVEGNVRRQSWLSSLCLAHLSSLPIFICNHFLFSLRIHFYMYMSD